MQSPSQKNKDFEAIGRTVNLIFDGARILHEMDLAATSSEAVRFQEWSRAVREELKLTDESKTKAQLIWLWECVRRAPSLRHLFGDLASATVPWTSKTDRFNVFPPDQLFLIGMNGGEVARLLQSQNIPATEERVSVMTEQPLRMRPGKHDRLECSDCKSIVTIRVDQTFEVEREADIMRIEADRIVVKERIIMVHVDSLNQAYTVSSRRLEPKRRSHGGRTYDHLVHVGRRKRMPLENIRLLVESGQWRPDLLSDKQIESIFIEPEQWGLRGDPCLWRELRQRFIDNGVPESIEQFDNTFQSYFQDLVGVVPATDQDSVFVPRYEPRGMSGGHVSPKWWRETGFPLLHKRFEQMTQTKSSKEPRDTDESD
jgi:hypothetical protein